MKTIVLVAGYATRLGELTKNFPKPLLKIGENTILGRMLDDIDMIRIILCKFAVRFLQVAGRGFEPPDLQVMGLTSCLCSTPHHVSKN